MTEAIKQMKNEPAPLTCPDCGSTELSCRCGWSQAKQQEQVQLTLVKSPEKSDRAIAKEVGVNQSTVSRTRKRMESNDALHQLEKRVGLDGKIRKQPTTKPESKPTKKQGAREEVYYQSDTSFKEFLGLLHLVDDYSADTTRVPNDRWAKLEKAILKTIVGLQRYLKEIER